MIRGSRSGESNPGGRLPALGRPLRGDRPDAILLCQAASVPTPTMMRSMADDCPVCLLYGHVALAAALLEDLVQPTMERGAVPPGLGGTIRLAHQRVQLALALAGQASALAGWDPAQLATCLSQLGEALNSWLTPAGISVVAALGRECRRQAHQLAWSYFARGRV
jgi:hypothetical protein